MKKYFDLLIVPQGKEPAFNFRISTFWARVLIFLVVLWIILLAGATVFYSKLAYKAVKADMLQAENEHLRNYNAKVVEIEKSFRKNLKLVSKIAAMAGVKLDDRSVSASLASLDSIVADTSRGVVTGIGGDKVPLSNEDLDKLRTPQGRPLYGWITRGFCNDDKDGQKHGGIDFAVREGTPIVATATGRVVFAGWDKDFGNMVIIDHENGYKTVYGHNQKLMAKVGEKVYKGDVIALSGNTGRSSAPHLHYEIDKDGVPIDPSPYLD